MAERTSNAQISQMLAAILIGLGMLTTAALAAEKAVPPEHNPPGDIPDTQVFVPYNSSLGFTIRVPEGWARKSDATSVHFADKYNVIDIVVSAEPAKPTLASARSDAVPTLESMGRAVKVGQVKDVKIDGNTAIMIAYTSNSDPNPVTNKQIRLEHDRYLFFKGGKLATLDMAAPQGADNVDAWRLMANSFRWR